MRVAIVSSPMKGGVRTITLKLVQALKNEGFHTDFINVRHVVVISSDNLRIINKLYNYDIILLTGSIPPVSSLFLRSKYTGLFVHGFVESEIKCSLQHHKIKYYPMILSTFTWWKVTNTKFFRPDFYICHSRTACRFNSLPEDMCVILPQFVLPIEIELFKKIRNNVIAESCNDFPQIISYSSFAYSPRLLSSTSLIHLARLLDCYLRRKVIFYIIDPKTLHEEIFQFSNIKVIKKPYMNRIDFLKLLARSDLFIERCIDEEIGITSIEAGLMKVPVAKITHPQFVEFQDYNQDEIIAQSSVKRLVNSISEYLNNIEAYKDYYGNKIYNFVLKKRSWETVKKPLIKKILTLSEFI